MRPCLLSAPTMVMRGFPARDIICCSGSVDLRPTRGVDGGGRLRKYAQVCVVVPKRVRRRLQAMRSRSDDTRTRCPVEARLGGSLQATARRAASGGVPFRQLSGGDPARRIVAAQTNRGTLRVGRGEGASVTEDDRARVCEECKQRVTWSEWRPASSGASGQIRQGRCGCPGMGYVQARPGRKKTTGNET